MEFSDYKGKNTTLINSSWRVSRHRLTPQTLKPVYNAVFVWLYKAREYEARDWLPVTW